MKANYEKIKLKPIHTKEQDLLTKSIGCIEKLSKSKPQINLGYYSGFFARYALEYSLADTERLKNSKYKQTSNKLKSAFNNYLFKGNLFSHRLDALILSCRKTLTWKE